MNNKEIDEQRSYYRTLSIIIMIIVSDKLPSFEITPLRALKIAMTSKDRSNPRGRFLKSS